MKERIRYIRHFALLLAAVLMVACSDSQEPETPEVDILSRFNSEGKAYLTLQIPLGGQAMTRTTFDDGSDDEWQVRDAYILIFAGANESAAKFASAYKVESPTLNTSAYEQITATITFTINDENINTGDKLYVFALLNNNSSAITTSSFPATSVSFANGTTLKGRTSSVSDLSGITIGSIKDDSDYFLMTNATLADAASTSAGLKTLVEVPASYFFPTEAQAEANPAGHINVERLAAKTTVELSDGLTYSILGNSYADFARGDLSWALDNYNTSSYAYKHLSAVSYQRFVENDAIEPYYPLRYRTHWAEDINYADGATTNFTNYTNSTLSWNSLDSSIPQYCAENTFDVANMKDNCTTSVLVRLQLNKGEDPDHRGDFYTTSVTGQDIIFQPPVNSLEEQGTSASSSFSRTRSNVVTYDGTNIATIDDYLRTWLMQNSSDFRDWVNAYAAGEPKHVIIAVSTPTGGGTATVTGVTQTARTLSSNEAETFSTTYANIINNNVILKFYDDGYCYYRVPIRHFDDSQAPWNSAPGMTGNGTDQAYAYSSKGTAKGTAFTGTAEEIAEAQAQEYLGRYGVVRNNWYNISINSVTHIGSPIIPALTDDADDKVEQLLNATLQISGWEGHNQDLYSE